MFAYLNVILNESGFSCSQQIYKHVKCLNETMQIYALLEYDLSFFGGGKFGDLKRYVIIFVTENVSFCHFSCIISVDIQ